MIAEADRYRQNILDRSIEAQRRITRGQTFTDWLEIAEGVRVITDDVMAKTGANSIQANAFKQAFGQAWRAHEALVSDDKTRRSITRQEISDLRFLLAHPAAIAWRAEQPPARQRRLLHPRTVIADWKAAERRKTATTSRREPQIGADAALRQELAAANARITELETRIRAEAKPESGLLRARGREPLNEVTKLRVQNAELRARILRLTPTLDGEVIKLRKEVEELRGERSSLKQALKKAAKERDRNAVIRSSPLLRAAARGDLKRERFNAIAKALHEDRLARCSKAELHDAASYFFELRPLFQFDQ
jgi:hypothetical protein